LTYHYHLILLQGLSELVLYLGKAGVKIIDIWQKEATKKKQKNLQKIIK